MSPKPATLTVPHDLTIPEPGSTTARAALSGAIRRVLQDLSRLASRSDPQLRAFRPRLARLLGETPGAVASVLRLPTISGLIRCLRRRAPELEFGPGVAELLATFYTELAVMGALPETVVLRRVPPRIVSLAGRRVIELPSNCARIELRNHELRILGGGGQTRIELGPARSSDSFPAITETLALALVDNNPLAMSEAHPDKQGNALDLGGKPASQWTETLARALDIIAQYMPDLRAEIDLYLHQIIPVGYHDRVHLSASYQEVIGTVYMTLHPQLMTMVEATIHEFQHNKLHAQLELDPLLDNAFSPLYSSPVRPDPRPLQGVLLAIHAFLPVARLYQLMRAAGHEGTHSHDFERRYAQIVAGNHEAAKVLLEHGQATKVGQGLLDEIGRWDAHPWETTIETEYSLPEH